MRAGNLRDRVQFERKTPGPDGYGNEVVSWAAIEISAGVPLVVWADVRETMGKEKVAAGRLEASRTATIRIRTAVATRALTSDDRLILRGQRWNIRSIAPVSNDRVALELLCELGVAI